MNITTKHTPETDDYALKWNGNNFQEIVDFIENSMPVDIEGNTLRIYKDDGTTYEVPCNSYVVKVFNS